MAANKYLTEVSPTKRFNTQPPEGGCISNLYKLNELKKVSTHSHPKVAAPRYTVINDEIDVSTHSHPKVAAARSAAEIINIGGFQHTATRRWLLNGFVYASCYGCVSTHSHPKVAAHRGRKHKNHQATFQHTATRRWLPGALRCMQSFAPSFNTQPPEGGCTIAQSFNWAVDVSTHSHPKVAAARLPPRLMYSVAVSTHSHPKVAACPKYSHRINCGVSTHSHPKVAAR